MFTQPVSDLHTAEYELRLVSFSSSPDNYKRSAQKVGRT